MVRSCLLRTIFDNLGALQVAMDRYFLPNHVHFGRRGDSLVFLDLRHDDYFLVNGRSGAALLALLANPGQGASPEVANALAELVQGGLLTTDQSNARELQPTQVELAMEALLDEQCPDDARVQLRHVVGFMISCTIAAYRLRFNRIEDIVTAVADRKRAAFGQRTDDVARARRLMAVFARLRSFFPRDYLCLYDSLALIEFLARYDVHPSWIFGVALEPWGAHCWVQDDQFVFNEGVEEAARFTPVMAI